MTENADFLPIRQLATITVYCWNCSWESFYMAEIQSLTFSITRTSSPVGHICRVDYSYYLYIDPQQYQHGDSFSVVVELHGDDIAHDQMLGKQGFDAHVVQFDSKMPQERGFVVPCELLNEALGVDKIYLKLIVRLSTGDTLTVKSQTIKDRF